MEYTEEQLKIFIKEKRPDLVKKPEPSLNDAVIAFLEKYEVKVEEIDPESIGFWKKDGGTLGGQKNQSKILEWTQWKQWALDHKDFPKFQTEFFNEVHTHNENIDKTLKDPDFQKEIKFFMTKRARTVKITMYSLLAFLLLIIGIPIIFNEFGYPKWYSDSFKLSRRQRNIWCQKDITNYIWFNDCIEILEDIGPKIFEVSLEKHKECWPVTNYESHLKCLREKGEVLD